VRHVINARGYRSHFTVSGRNDRSLLGLVAGNGLGNGTAHGDGIAGRRTPGFVRGLVSDNADPDKLGRVKVKFPWLDEAYSSSWAPVMQLGAGPESGTFFLPAVDDEVLVGFEQGRIDRPVVFGGLFNMTDKPPNYGQWLDNGAVTGRGIVSRKGHHVTFHDADDIFGINIVAVDSGKATAVSIGLNGKDKKLVVHSEGDVDVDATGNVSIKGAKISVEAQGELVLKGATVKINSARRDGQSSARRRRQGQRHVPEPSDPVCLGDCAGRPAAVRRADQPGHHRHGVDRRQARRRRGLVGLQHAPAHGHRRSAVRLADEPGGADHERECNGDDRWQACRDVDVPGRDVRHPGDGLRSGQSEGPDRVGEERRWRTSSWAPAGPSRSTSTRAVASSSFRTSAKSSRRSG
jgi:phage baseplate assembly protein gpV